MKTGTSVCLLRLRPAGSAFCWSVLCSRCRSGRGEGAGWRTRAGGWQGLGGTDGQTEIYVQISRIDECPARPVDAETAESRLWVGRGGKMRWGNRGGRPVITCGGRVDIGWMRAWRDER